MTRWLLHIRMIFNVLYSDCTEHAKRGRSSSFLLWSRPFTNWNSSIYCCQLLCFRLVSSLVSFSFVYWNWKKNYILFTILFSSVDDRVKKSLPENFQKKAEASLVTALVSASLATLTCYPLDTVRRQMQMRGTPYKTVLDAFPG